MLAWRLFTGPFKKGWGKVSKNFDALTREEEHVVLSSDGVVS
jgi:hypothetical protein